jgi:hypothetical protein
MKIYQTLSLRTLATFSLSMCNGSHRPAESEGKQQRTKDKSIRQAGSALSASPELQQAVTRLCRFKEVNVGSVTSKLDAIFITNSQRADARREKKRLDDEEAATRKMAKKGIKFNNALEEPLAATVGDLEAHLQSMGNAVGCRKNTLSDNIMRAYCGQRKMNSPTHR